MLDTERTARLRELSDALHVRVDVLAADEDRETVEVTWPTGEWTGDAEVLAALADRVELGLPAPDEDTPDFALLTWAGGGWAEFDAERIPGVEFGVLLDALGSMDIYSTKAEALEKHQALGGFGIVEIRYRRIPLTDPAEVPVP